MSVLDKARPRTLLLTRQSPQEVEQKAQFAGEFLRCLIELDVDGILRLHAVVFPAQTFPSSRTEALASLHLARTKSDRVPMKLKRYSQKWLNERGLGSWFNDDSDRRQR